jgi:putative two-component system response regulator
MPKILVVDDEARVREVLRRFLIRDNYEVIEAANGEEAMDLLKSGYVDLILLDVRMPKLDGFGFCEKIKANEQFRFIPVIMLTAFSDEESKIKGIQCGVDDFLNKPVNMNELLARARVLIKSKYLNEQLENTESVLFILARVVEAKDPCTKDHLKRMASYSRDMAQRLGLPHEMILAIEYAGILHDIGKIGISESILAKPSSLTKEEFEEIKKHSIIGEEIVKPLRFAKIIAPAVRGHHEWWNGSGYPDGLSGENISLGARIISIIDAYDAITCDRPYRKGRPSEKAISILLEGRGGQWDPRLVDVFVEYLQSNKALRVS